MNTQTVGKRDRAILFAGDVAEELNASKSLPVLFWTLTGTAGASIIGAVVAIVTMLNN